MAGFGGVGGFSVGLGMGMLGQGLRFPSIIPPIPFIPGMRVGIPLVGKRDVSELTVSNSTETLCELSTLTVTELFGQ